MKLELAPAAVLRAAAWPVEALDVFGDPDLRPKAESSEVSEAAYDAAIERERAALWERTAGEPRFMRALLFASPSLFARVRQFEGRRSRRNKRVRHVETSLYRYLARAATRTTPSGLWTGVTLARFGSEEKVARASPRVDITLDLAVFAATVSALAGRAPYRDSARWRLNSTLRRQPDGTWHFIARLPGGGLDAREIGADPALDACFERLARAGTGTLAELSGLGAVPRRLVDTLADGGALVGGLAFPARFTSAWQALAAVETALAGTDRSAWRRAVSALFELASALGERLDELTADEVAARLSQARLLVAGLLGELQVQAPLPETVLRCDLCLPLDVTLGPKTRASLERALFAYQREWIDGLSPTSAARRDRRCALAAALGQRRVRLGEMLPAISAPPDAARQRAWAETFNAANGSAEAASFGEAPFNPSTSAPWGCLLARLGPSGVTTVLGIDDNPIRSCARYSTLLGADNEAERWVHQLFSDMASRHRVQVGDLAVPFERNPNVLSRPTFSSLAVEPWGVEGIDLRGAELCAETGAILFDVPSVGSMVAFPFCSASTLTGDPIAGAIAQSGFEEPIEPIFRAASAFAPDEGAEPRYASRLRLSTGAVIRPRRTCFAASFLDDFTRLPRRARYARWCELADRLGWPEQLAVSIDDAAPLYLHASSPLAVEAVFEGSRSARRIVVEEADPSTAVAGPDGHHVADVAVPFSREPHSFSGRVASR